jgi:hypothetical protein
MAAEGDLARLLGVAPGCVTPLALAHGAAADVLALLDRRLRAADGAAAAAAPAAAPEAPPPPPPRFFAHPAVNSASVALDSRGLERFLAAAGRDPSRHAWADLELAAAVGKDCQGDLKPLLDAVPAPPPPPPDEAAAAAAAAASSGGGGGGGPSAAGLAGGLAAMAIGRGGGRAGGKGAAAAAAARQQQQEDGDGAAAAKRREAARRLLELTDVRARADELLGLASATMLGRDLASSGLEGTYALSRLRADFEAALGALKNAAHAGGRAAARGELLAAAAGVGRV